MKHLMAVIINGVFLFWLLGTGTVFPHETHHSVRMGKAVIIAAEHEHDDPMSFAAYKIYAPGGGTTEFQNGRTDSNGRLAFVPNVPGEWRVKIGDGMGHGADVAVKVTPEMTIQETVQGGLHVWQKILMAASVVWGALGTALYFRKRG